MPGIIFLSYKINVYDNGTLVGNAIVTIDSDEFSSIKSSYTHSFKKIINVKVDRYISGNYTLELEYITGKVYN